MEYKSVDVTKDETAQEVLLELSKGRFGCSASMVTPTVLVGTRVIKGGDMQAIEAAREAQSNWPEDG